MLMAVMLFCMPVGAFIINPRNSFQAYAQDSESFQTVENSEFSTEVIKPEESTAETQENESTEESTENTDGVISDKDTEIESEPVCICTETCGVYHKNLECKVCRENTTGCQYIEPNVKITIKKPAGWHKDSAKIKVSVEDTLNTGNFSIQRVEVKIAQNGSWTEITEDMYTEISENCSVYVRVTDQKGKIYEKNRSLNCFDNTKPTLNAAVSDGVLSIQAQDSQSGVAAIYVNGYEFTDITNGMLNIRLQQFDSGYQNFNIQAIDEVGNLSEVYKTANPYYTDPQKESDSTEKNPAEQLPVNAAPTKPTNASANVIEHTKTDSQGNKTVSSASKENGSDGNSEGKEFYTIQTASEKVFYLVIDRNGEEEVVHFLTEISENDLLNVTTDNSEVLPKNSAAMESAIQAEESALPTNEGEISDAKSTNSDSGEIDIEESTEGTDTMENEQPLEEERGNFFATYIFWGIVAVIVGSAVYFFKIYRKKGEDFEDEEDDEVEEEYENEDEESEENFFESNEESVE